MAVVMFRLSGADAAQLRPPTIRKTRSWVIRQPQAIRENRRTSKSNRTSMEGKDEKTLQMMKVCASACNVKCCRNRNGPKPKDGLIGRQQRSFSLWNIRCRIYKNFFRRLKMTVRVAQSNDDNSISQGSHQQPSQVPTTMR